MAPRLGLTKEELHAYAEPFLCARIAILAIDGPGQGEASTKSDLRRLRARRARGVRTDREARRSRRGEDRHVGVSLGLYAPRATAYERRIRAARALRAVRVEGNLGRAAVLTREAFSRAQSIAQARPDALRHAATLSMKEAAAKIACPISSSPARGPARAGFACGGLAKGVSGPVELLDRRGRRAQCQTTALSLSKPDGRLACRAAGAARI